VESTSPVPTRNGSRLALVGAIVYLLEWAFIIPSGVRVPPEGSGPAEIAAAYAGQPLTGISFMVAGLIIVLLGRILFSAGVRSVLRQTNETRVLGDFALGAMTVSVVLEIMSEVVRLITTQLAAQGADRAVLTSLHETWRTLTFPVIAALGASILASSMAMLLSRAFPRWVAVLGVATGLLWIGLVFYGTLTNSVPGVAGIVWLAWAVWLLATGVILFRRAGPIRSPRGSASPA
jgi:hypothetical protein